MSRFETKTLNLKTVRFIHAGWLVVGAALALTFIGIETIGTTRPATAVSQLRLACLGVAAGIIVAFIPAKRLRQASWWLLGFRSKSFGSNIWFYSRTALRTFIRSITFFCNIFYHYDYCSYWHTEILF